MEKYITDERTGLKYELDGNSRKRIYYSMKRDRWICVSGDPNRMPTLAKPISDYSSSDIWQYILVLLADKHGTIDLPVVLVVMSANHF